MIEKRYSKMMNHYGTSRTYCTGIYDNQNNRELENSNQVIIELNALHEKNEQLKQSMDRLFDYFQKWFEEERGIYIEDFIILWNGIKKGDVE